MGKYGVYLNIGIWIGIILFRRQFDADLIPLFGHKQILISLPVKHQSTSATLPHFDVRFRMQTTAGTDHGGDREFVACCPQGVLPAETPSAPSTKHLRHGVTKSRSHQVTRRFPVPAARPCCPATRSRRATASRSHRVIP